MKQVGVFVNAITLEDVKKAKPKKIFCSAITCWWTHDPAHLCKNKVGLPCDPRGGVLFETEDVEGFFKMAEEQSDHYGKHGLRAFMSAHHLNCRVGKMDHRSTCFEKWDEYNRMIDEFDAENN